MAQRSLLRRLWYDLIHTTCRLATIVLYRVRVDGQENLPMTGSVVICSNHQSHLDPIVLGSALNRRLNFLARESLFKFKPFGDFLKSVDTIPIDLEGTSFAGMKEALKRLKRGEGLLLYPEGTRTPDGQLQPLQPGFVPLARRAKAQILPMAVDGTFQAWPRTRNYPQPGVAHIVIGKPLSTAEIEALDDEQLTSEVQQRIQACLEKARASRLSVLSNLTVAT